MTATRLEELMKICLASSKEQLSGVVDAITQVEMVLLFSDVNECPQLLLARALRR